MYDEKGKRTVEGGKGVRYVVLKTIRLAPGFHRVFFGLPEDKFTCEFDISLKVGKSILEFKPVYRPCGRPNASFLNGICDFEIFYNGTSYSLTSNCFVM